MRGVDVVDSSSGLVDTAILIGFCGVEFQGLRAIDILVLNAS
jgi:hypothetical protein